MNQTKVYLDWRRKYYDENDILLLKMNLFPDRDPSEFLNDDDDDDDDDEVDEVDEGEQPLKMLKQGVHVRQSRQAKGKQKGKRKASKGKQ